jgi:hypothetical protein
MFISLSECPIITPHLVDGASEVQIKPGFEVKPQEMDLSLEKKPEKVKVENKQKDS